MTPPDTTPPRVTSRYLLAVFVSGFGSSALWLAAGVWTKDLTGSDSLAALCVCALWAPQLAGPFLGSLADRGRRRRLLVTVNPALAVLVLALCAVDGPDRIWILFTVLVLYGACGVVTDAAEVAYVSGLVAGDALGRLNGLRMSVNEGMKIVAPLAGAGLYAARGGPAVALLDAVTFAVAAWLFGSLPGPDLKPVRDPKPAPGPKPARPVPGDSTDDTRTRAGLGEIWHHPLLRPLLATGSAAMVLAGISGASVFAVVDALGRAPSYAGVLYAVQGAGSVVVGLLTGRLLERFGERRFAAFGVALFALGVGARAVPVDAAALAGSAAIGVGLPCPLVAALTAVQRAVPGERLGRVAGAANTLLFTPNAVALAAGAGLVAVAPPALLLPVLGGAGLAVAAWCLRGAVPATASRPDRARSDR